MAIFALVLAFVCITGTPIFMFFAVRSLKSQIVMKSRSVNSESEVLSYKSSEMYETERTSVIKQIYADKENSGSDENYNDNWDYISNEYDRNRDNLQNPRIPRPARLHS